MWQICGLLLTVWAVSVLAVPSIGSFPACDNETKALTSDGVVQCPYYYNLLESALLANGSGNLYRLQQAFFPRNTLSPSKLLINLTVTVDEIQSVACDDFCVGVYGYDCLSFPSCGTNCILNRSYQYRDKPHSLLHCIIENVVVDFAASGFIIPYIYIPSDPSDEALCTSGDGQPTVNILLHLEQLPCNPDLITTDLVVLNLVTWVSLYLPVIEAVG